MRGFLISLGTVAAALLTTGTDAQAASAVPKDLSAAVADPARPEDDRKRDADRKPAECLAFAGLRPGQSVADLLPGRGYFTRIFSAVVGPKGRVYAVAPPKRPNAAADAPEPAAAVQAIAADPHYSNVTVSTQRLTQLSLPEPVDLIWTSQNYHDLHNIPDIEVGTIDKAVFNALKPGGVFIVLDHAAQADSGFRDTSTLHRIDPVAVQKEVVAAGFKFEGQSNVLRNPNDPHTVPVFEPSIRGKTDQFILKFRKPK